MHKTVEEDMEIDGMGWLWRMESHMKEKVLHDGSRLGLANLGLHYQLRLGTAHPSAPNRIGMIYQHPAHDFKDWPNERILTTYERIESQDDFHRLTGVRRF